jgi:transposase
MALPAGQASHGSQAGHALTFTPDHPAGAGHDRWHLLEKRQCRLSGRGPPLDDRDPRPTGRYGIDPALLTRAERLQYEGYLGREAMNAAIIQLAKDGLTIRAIVRQTGCSRKTARQVLRGERSDVFRCGRARSSPGSSSSTASGVPDAARGAELWRRLKALGFRGSLRVVSEWATRRRRSERSPSGHVGRTPSARRLARLMTSGRSQLSKADAIMVAAIETALPSLAKARELVERFQTMVRSRSGDDLEAWIGNATGSALAPFATGIRADREAVAAAIAEPGRTARPRARSPGSSS